MHTPQKSKVAEPKISPRINVGATIRRLRDERGLKGVELCRRAKGLDPKTLTALEKGRIRNPSIATLQAVAEGFGMTVSDLFRQAELQTPEFFSMGTQKGLYKIDFPAKGMQLISFTPLAEDLFCGKMIVDGQKGFDEKLLGHVGAFFIMVLVGQFEGNIEGRKVSLREGDNLFFCGGMKFRLLNTLQRNSVFLLVTAPSCLKARRFSAPARVV
ncbi:MAG TPA: helix-turn-helix transcriptional regulator [Candidatus Omnitrophota bacterium]|nr:helix-turn-helix transcriptional regulator [Candidatus Omnitrophota bacterium]HPS36718.1 helix-turn-helix transcriptional regulator [Candidatus Omnitrophota bacterium]